MTASGAPPPYDRAGLVERGVTLVQQITLRNVLIFALLVAICAPAWFVYKFTSDKDFREEWDSYVKLSDVGVPCLVFVMAEIGGRPRSVIATAYDVEPRYERLIGYRAPGVMSKEQIAQACEAVHADVNAIRVLISNRDPASRTGEGK